MVWTDISRGRKLTCSFAPLPGYDKSRPMMNRYEQRTALLAYQVYVAPTLPVVCISVCIYVYVYEVRRLHALIPIVHRAYNRVYRHVYHQRIAEEALRACRRWEQYITLAHVCLSSLTLSLPHSVFSISVPLSPMPFESPYARPLFYSLIIFTHFLQPA